MSTLIAVLLEALVERHNDRVVLGGTANLTEHALDFPAIRPVLEALEEQVVLLRLFDQSATSSQIVVSIGNENEHAGSDLDLGRRERLPGARRRRSARSACSARGGWTTGTPWPGWRPWLATSASCWPSVSRPESVHWHSHRPADR